MSIETRFLFYKNVNTNVFRVKNRYSLFFLVFLRKHQNSYQDEENSIVSGFVTIMGIITK